MDCELWSSHRVRQRPQELWQESRGGYMGKEPNCRSLTSPEINQSSYGSQQKPTDKVGHREPGNMNGHGESLT